MNINLLNIRQLTQQFGCVAMIDLSLFVGCDQSQELSDSEMSNVEPAVETITSQQAHALIETRTQEQVETLEQRLRFLDGDRRLVQAFNDLFGGSEECVYTYDQETGEEFEECFESEEEELESIEIDFTEGLDDAISDLLAELSPDRVIADTDELSYRVPTEMLCEVTVDEFDEEEPLEIMGEFREGDQNDTEADTEVETEIDPVCLEVMERHQPQLRLVGYGDGIRGELLVNQGETVAFTAILTSTEARLSADLKVLRDVAAEMEEADRDPNDAQPFELPTVSGTISVALLTQEINRATFQFDVLEPVTIQGQFDDEVDNINITIPASEGLFTLSSDASTPSIKLNLNLPSMSHQLSTYLGELFSDDEEFEDDFEDEFYDEDTSEDRLDEPAEEQDRGPLRQLKIKVGGVNFGVELQLVDTIRTIFEIGLGDESTTLNIDNNEVVKVDLNADSGRRVRFELSHEDMSEQLKSTLTFLTSQNLLQVTSKLGLIEEIEAPDFMSDEIFKFSATASEEMTPIIALIEEQLQVVEGLFKMEAVNASRTVEVDAGQCINSIDNEELDETFENESMSQEHPFDSIEGGMCQAPQGEG